MSISGDVKHKINLKSSILTLYSVGGRRLAIASLLHKSAG